MRFERPGRALPGMMLILVLAVPAQGQVMVADINRTTLGSRPGNLVVSGGRAFFSADDGVHGTELWTSDGTSEGTRLVRDLTPGGDGSTIRELTVVDGRVFVQTDDALWRSDGTEAGTIPLHTFEEHSIRFGTAFDGRFFFQADDGVHGIELWASDGTPEGTALVLDIATGTPGPAGDADPSYLTPFDGALFFTTAFLEKGSNRWRSSLWKTDGTAEGTIQVTDGPFDVGFHLYAASEMLYMAGYDEDHGGELWTSDGTPEGTRLVKDLAPGTASSEPRYFTEVNGRVVFEAYDDAHGYELWVTDGTGGGTTLLKDVRPGPPSSGLWDFRSTGSLAFFTADDGERGNELWVTDGTSEGTELVKDVGPGADNGALELLSVVDGQVYLCANDGVNGVELWRSDGTAEGTVMVADINPGVGDSNPSGVVSVAGRLLVSAISYPYGRELWTSDGTPEGTRLLKAIQSSNPTNQSASPREFAVFRDRLFFQAHDGLHGRELWQSDGTEDGTHLVADLARGALSGTPTHLTVSGDRLFFVSHATLWRSDGTSEGTGAVMTLPSNPVQWIRFVPAPHGVFFSAHTAEQGNELWTSDGTPEGTRLLRDIRPGPGDALSDPEDLVLFDGALYFKALDGVHGAELWTSDGTPEGTVLVTEIVPGFSGGVPGGFVEAGGRLFFHAWEGAHGWTLWATDGTADGTARVKDINPGTRAFSFLNLGDRVAGGETLFFAGWDDAFGWQLWRSDGTEAGTVRVSAIQEGPAGAPLRDLLWVDEQLFFIADDGEHGAELWRSDGTEQGTRLVVDLAPGGASSDPESLRAVLGGVLFEADDGSGDRGVWWSNGTASGTVRIDGLPAGQDRALLGETLFFALNDGVHGTELWKLSLGGLSLDVADADVDLPAGFAVSDVFPNPFQDRAHVTLSLDRPERVRVAVYDVLGRVVARVFDGRLPAGRHTLDVSGADWAGGLYLLRVEGERFRSARGVLHVR